MITKQDILDGGNFIVSIPNREYTFNLIKDGGTLKVRGAMSGGRLHYIGSLYPKSGHLLRTSKTLKERHTGIADVFRWIVSMLWVPNELPKNVSIKFLETESC